MLALINLNMWPLRPASDVESVLHTLVLTKELLGSRTATEDSMCWTYSTRLCPKLLVDITAELGNCGTKFTIAPQTLDDAQSSKRRSYSISKWHVCFDILD